MTRLAPKTGLTGKVLSGLCELVWRGKCNRPLNWQEILSGLCEVAGRDEYHKCHWLIKQCPQFYVKENYVVRSINNNIPHMAMRYSQGQRRVETVAGLTRRELWVTVIDKHPLKCEGDVELKALSKFDCIKAFQNFVRECWV